MEVVNPLDGGQLTQFGVEGREVDALGRGVDKHAERLQWGRAGESEEGGVASLQRRGHRTSRSTLTVVMRTRMEKRKVQMGSAMRRLGFHLHSADGEIGQ